MIAQLPMLYEILELDKRSKSGNEDVDEIPGIEKLWNARAHYNHRYLKRLPDIYFKELNEE